jgi:hypothetical protein
MQYVWSRNKVIVDYLCCSYGEFTFCFKKVLLYEKLPRILNQLNGFLCVCACIHVPTKWYFEILFSEPDLKQLENSAEIFNALSDIPGNIEDVDHLLDVRMFFIASSFRYTLNLGCVNTLDLRLTNACLMNGIFLLICLRMYDILFNIHL